MIKRGGKKRPIKEYKNQLFIFCEGSVTEPSYLERYKVYAGKGEEIKIVDTKKNTHFALVNEAACLKKDRTKSKIKSIDIAINQKVDSGLEGDQFWVVFDREAESKVTKREIARACEKAYDNGIGVIITNVCFEVWLLLHWGEDISSCYQSHDDFKNNSDYKQMLAYFKLDHKDIKRQGQTDKLMAELVKDNKVKKAKKLAEQMCIESEKAASQNTPFYDLNPYANIHLLLEAIDKFKS